MGIRMSGYHPGYGYRGNCKRIDVQAQKYEEK